MSTVASAPVLEISGVSKTFGGTRALQDLSLDVRGGEVHAVVGQNGSGKSTLVKILSGFHDVDDDARARVAIGGEPIHLHDPEKSRAAGLRFVHQDLGLVGNLSTVENLALGPGFETGAGGRIRWGAERRHAEEALDRLGYSFDVDAPVHTLKAAERTGIAVARALDGIDAARVLVIDEPTATLPNTEVAILFEAIERVRAHGLGIIYISHRLNEIFAIGNRVTVLRDGRKVGTYDVEDVDSDELISLMVGARDLEAHREPGDRPEGEVVLRARGLTGPTLLDVDFEVRRGEILGFAGLTGSGREELAPLIFGAGNRAGTVTVADREIPAGSTRAAVAAGIGFVPPNRHAQGEIQGMTVADNCTITGLRRHVGPFGFLRRGSERAEVEGWIDSLEIRPPDPEALIGALSGGNQQKVVLAKWLRTDPAVLLLDEPTQGVDVGAKGKIHQLVREATKGGAAIVIASSDEDELCEVCDRILVLNDGRIRGELTAERMNPSEIVRMEL